MKVGVPRRVAPVIKLGVSSIDSESMLSWVSVEESLDIELLYERYGHSVHKRCLYLLKNEAAAEDAMHDVFIKVLENREGFRGAASPLTWMVRIATNHCLNLIRSKRATWMTRFFRTKEVGRQTHTGFDEALEVGQVVQHILHKVPNEVAEAALYYFVDDMTQADAARACECSVPTLRKRLKEFVVRARRELEGMDPDLVFAKDIS